jgi:hypothetical protein
MVRSLSDLRKAVEHEVIDAATLADQWGDNYGSAGSAIESEIEAYKRYFEEKLQDIENSANRLYTEAVSGANPEVVIIPKPNSGDEGGSDSDNDSDSGEGEGVSGSGAGVVLETVVVYGYLRHVANSETSLENLAQRYLGDPDKAYIIASINGISGDEDIQPGDQINIPILSQNSMNALNHVFGSVDNRDAWQHRSGNQYETVGVGRKPDKTQYLRNPRRRRDAGFLSPVVHPYLNKRYRHARPASGAD